MTLRARQSGFTLFEMLVVLGIVATVAGVGAQVLTGVREDAQSSLARAEMSEIAAAIQRFHRDTGYWPKEGPFAADKVGNVPLHPANLSQLRVQPVKSGVDILPFDAASGTGWNGPYIRELDAATVWVGEDMGTTPDGSVDPDAGTETDVSGIGDPFDRAADGVYFAWTDGAGDTIARLGRPYLYFIDAGATGTVPGCTVPCLVSFGPDGDYDTADDIVLNIAGH